MMLLTESQSEQNQRIQLTQLWFDFELELTVKGYEGFKLHLKAGPLVQKLSNQIN